MERLNGARALSAVQAQRGRRFGVLEPLLCMFEKKREAIAVILLEPKA
jgi:hypothetical protein